MPTGSLRAAWPVLPSKPLAALSALGRWGRALVPVFGRIRLASNAAPPPELGLTRFVLLAALLHLWLVLMFGSVSGGTAPPGEGVFGAINITLRGGFERGTRAPAPPVAADPGPVGTAVEPRFGGAVREEHQAPRSNDGPGAARLGQWSSVPSPGAVEARPSGELRPPDAPPASVAAAPEVATTAVLASRGPGPAQQGATPATSTSVAAAAAPLPRSAPQAPATQESAADRQAPSSTESRPTETPRAAMSAEESPLKAQQGPAPAAALPVPPAPPTREPEPVLRSLGAAPSSARPSSAPAQALNTPAPLAAAVPRLAEAPTLPAIRPVEAVAERSLAPLPAPVPVTPQTAPIQAATPIATPMAAPAVPTVPALPAVSALPAATSAAPPGAANQPTAPTAGTAAASVPAAPGSAAPGAGAPSSPATTARTEPAPGAGIALPRTAGPDAGARVGRDIATPPSAAASTPRLNLELPRARGGEIARQAPRGVLELLPQPPERKTKLEQGIERSARKDCKEAYGGAGLLAVVPIVIDTVRDKGCKW